MRKTLAAIAELIEQGRLDVAATRAEHARARFRNEAEPARLHGVALLSMGEVDAAIAAFEVARALAPDSIETLCNLGSAWLARGHSANALAALQAARQLAPDHPAVLNGLGNAHAAAGEPRPARDAYAAATRAAPGYLGAWLNLAAAELALGQADEGERILRMILTRTEHPEARMLLGQALAAQRRWADAEQAFAAGARLVPDDARFAYQVGLMADEQKRPADAARAFARALALDPGMTPALAQLVFIKRQLCDWRDLEVWSTRLRGAVDAGAAGVTPFGFLAEPATAAEQLRCARTFAATLRPARMPFEHARRAPAAALRVGFISNGFGNHPTGLLTVAMFEALRGHGLELELFATAPADGKHIERRLKAAADAWHDLDGMSPARMAEQIHARGIEILVDLRVWGGGNVSSALALRPAPVQVNWLAYPGTSGAPWLDYVIADRVVLPASMRAHYSEAVAWLPRCFQPSDPTRVVGEPPSRIDCGLPAAGVVYVCFNNSYKLNPRSVARMLAILRGVPDSVLWLLAGPDGADDALRAVAQSEGVDPARLVFMPKLAHDAYLTRYRHADLFLDCNPYNAHTTASDAIWAGCPVLTVPGETFAARVAASLNAHLGMPELNVDDDAAFVAFAVSAGQDRNLREALRERVAECRRLGGLFDMQGFARDFAALLQEIAARHRGGHAPAPIDGQALAR